MIIQVDEAGKDVIEQFCDLALKQGGMTNREQINSVIDTMVLISAPKKKRSAPKPKSKALRKKK